MGTPRGISSVLLMWVSHMCCSYVLFMWDDYKWVIFGTIMCAYDNWRGKQDEDIRGCHMGSLFGVIIWGCHVRLSYWLFIWGYYLGLFV